MLGKLSVRNAKRQAKDYIIYFITVIISVALMFSFNSIAVSKDISELSYMMENFKTAIMGISILVIFIMVWLINYTMKFILDKRSKEFGTYQILGLEKKDISNMFTLENLLIGIVAFVFGIVIGMFLYQIFTSIIMNLFNQAYKIEIAFDLKAVGLTAAYFFGIFILVLLNCRRKIKKTKVYDLLYADKINENNIIKKSKGNVVVFILSIVLMGIAIYLNDTEFKNPSTMTGNKVFLAIGLLILGIYMFYISLSSFIVKRYLKNKVRKYKKDNMFLYRNLTSKINTMSITMGTIALMVTVILIGGNVALLMNSMLNNELEMGYPFEIMVTSVDGDFSKYKEYIENNSDVTDMYEYKIYCINETEVADNAFIDTVFSGRSYIGYDTVLLLSDYNNLRKMLGYEEVTLDDDEVIINCMKTAKGILEDYTKKNNTVNITGKTMRIKEVKEENLAQVGFNGYYYAFVVPDNMKDAVEKESVKLEDASWYLDTGYKLVANTKGTTSEDFYNGLSRYILTEEKEVTEEIDGVEQTYTVEVSLDNVQTRGMRTSETKSFYAIISFLAFYIALVFIMGAATMLAIQQLSDSEKYKYRYSLLKKLGMDEKNINKIIFKQLLFYFAIPMLVPIIVSIPVVLSVGHVFTIAITTGEIIKNMLIILGLFILVYGIYFIATDVQFSRNIEEGR